MPEFHISTIPGETGFQAGLSLTGKTKQNKMQHHLAHRRYGMRLTNGLKEAGPVTESHLNTSVIKPTDTSSTHLMNEAPG
jgi:hypothetical protein